MNTPHAEPMVLLPHRAFLIPLFGLLAATQLRAGEISFAPAVNYAAGHSPTRLVVADMDGDGAPDVIVNNDGAGIGRFVLLLNDGSGALSAPIAIGAPDNVAFAVGDVDGDGDIDVVTSSSPQNYWYENDGNANFTEHRFRQSSFRATSIAFCDYDNDGDEDVGVVTVLGDAEIATNLGNGRFSVFQGRHLFDTDCCSVWTTAIDAVDLRGDGRRQFVIASHAPRTFIRLDWMGARRFEPVVFHNFGRVDGVAYGDIDGAGGTDVVFIHDASNQNSAGVGVRIALNDGAGGLVAQAPLGRELGRFPLSTVVQDFDQDGTNEIVVFSALTSTLRLATWGGGAVTRVFQTHVMAGGDAMAVADLDGDEFPELILTKDTGVVVLGNTSTP